MAYSTADGSEPRFVVSEGRSHLDFAWQLWSSFIRKIPNIFYHKICDHLLSQNFVIIFYQEKLLSIFFQNKNHQFFTPWCPRSSVRRGWGGRGRRSRRRSCRWTSGMVSSSPEIDQNFNMTMIYQDDHDDNKDSWVTNELQERFPHRLKLLMWW